MARRTVLGVGDGAQVAAIPLAVYLWMVVDFAESGRNRLVPQWFVLIPVGVFALVVALTFVPVRRKPDEPPPAPPVGGTTVNVSSTNQSGNAITAHTVNQGPPPPVVALQPVRSKNERFTSEYVTRCAVDVQTVSPVKRIEIRAYAPSILAVRASSRLGMTVVEHFGGVTDGTVGTAGTYVFDAVQPLEVELVTSGPESEIRVEVTHIP